MEDLVQYREQLHIRFQGLCSEFALSEENGLLCQVWMSNDGASNGPFLRLAAHSQVPLSNESIRTYASLSEHYGIRQEATDLIGDCLLKGATRVIEDLEHADTSQHPRNLLPGSNIPACSALFVPIFDPANPFARQHALGMKMPTAVLEILVCKTARTVHHNSDLINAACEHLDRYKFGISPDTTAFREWSKFLPPRTSGISGIASPSRGSYASSRSGLSRTCSTAYLLNFSGDSDDLSSENIHFSSGQSHLLGSVCEDGRGRQPLGIRAFS